MLALGVFGGRYMRDCQKEFPRDWFTGAKLLPDSMSKPDKKLNYFGVHTSQSLAELRRRGWIRDQGKDKWCFTGHMMRERYRLLLRFKIRAFACLALLIVKKLVTSARFSVNNCLQKYRVWSPFCHHQHTDSYS